VPLSTEDYCPYDIVNDLADLDLMAGHYEIDFGRLFFVRSRARRSPSVRLFLHGVGGTWASWSPLIQQTRHDALDLGDCIFVDLPGFGRSENRLGQLHAAAVGKALLDAVCSEGWQEVNLVGHSMGGFLALDMASRADQRIKSCSIISGAYFSIIETVQAPLRTLKRDPNAAVAYLSLSALAYLGPLGPRLMETANDVHAMPFLLRNTVAHPALLRPSVLDNMARNMRPRSFLLAAQNGKGYNPFSQWSKITVPLYALFGSADHLVPPVPDAERLGRVQPQARIDIVEDVGHFAHIERPARTVELLFRP
jgi:pimeloyl-ACP methyl ester carboxylesterase